MHANFEMLETTISETVKNEKGEGERKEIGKISYLCPTLAEFSVAFADAETVRDAKTNELSYVNPKLNWLYGAVQSAARAILTSKLEPKSINYKPGYSAWTDFQSMIATTGQRGQAMVTRKEFNQLFAAYVAKLGKSEKWTSAMCSFASKAAALAGTTETNKVVFANNLEKFEATLDEGQKQKYLSIMLELATAASGEQIDLEDDAPETPETPEQSA